MLPVRAITFDVGGAIIEPWLSVGHGYAGATRDFGMDGLVPETLTANFVRVWKARHRFDSSRAGWCGIVRESLGRRGDVLPALEGLRRQGLKPGVISSRDERLRPCWRG